MSKYKFMIYADGGSKTFMGHLMRTVALADTLRESAIEVIFATSSEDGKEYIEKNGFPVLLIEELDYSIIADLAKEKDVSGIIVDRFGFTKEEHELLMHKVGLLVHIDDFLYDGPAQLVINSTIDEKPKGRTGRWLCGGKYAIVRKQFVNAGKKILEIPQNMLLTTGYGDPEDIHLKILIILQKLLPELKKHVIVGGGYTTKEQLRKMASEDMNICLYENVHDLSGIMHKADFAISAAGTTLYELAAAGVPTIAFSLYDNQLDNMERVAKKGCILPIGWYKDINFIHLEKQVIDLNRNYELRKRLSCNGMSWIDGKGNSRIVKAVMEELQRNEENSHCNNKIVEY